MKFSLLTDPSEIKAAGWSSFVYAHPDATVFQSAEMHDFFSSVPGFEPVVVAVADDRKKLAGILLGVIIREMKGLGGYFSSRTVVYGGPLVDPERSDHDRILEKILEGLIRKVHDKSIFIQFRNFTSQEKYIKSFDASGFHLRERLNLIVDTSTIETVVKNMSESRWRQIRKGLAMKLAVGSQQLAVGDQQSADRGQNSKLRTQNSKLRTQNSKLRTQNSELRTQNSELKTQNSESHARIIVPSSLSQVHEFYDILHKLYKYKVKKPLPSWEFFEQFYKMSKEGRLGIIRLVEFQGKIIGGILSPVTPGKTIYEWYVCGLDREYKHVYPSALATWAALEYALDHNIPQFDFMGVGLPNREYGVREFKSRFGGEMVNHGRFARVSNKVFYAVAEAGYNVLSLLRKI